MSRLKESASAIAKKVFVPKSIGHAIVLTIVCPGGFIALGWYLLNRKPPTKEERERECRRISRELVGKGAI